MPNASRTRAATVLVISAAVAWHLLTVLAPAWVTVGAKPTRGRDFASYYYAVVVASEGGDPYVRGELGQAARDDGSRRGVHPFLYPPPFLLLMTWAVPMDLIGAYKAWFWLDELWLAAAVIALWRWWRPLGAAATVTLAVSIAVYTAVPANHVMGQANFPGLALAIIGLWASDRGRWATAGLFMGAACMVKMSPALFVGWFLLRGRWREAVGSCLTAVGLSVAVLPVLDVEHQLLFYTRVLPSFGSGDYNGLTVPIDMFGNHSVPNLWHQVLYQPGRTLTQGAQWASTATTLAMVGVMAYAFRKGHDDLLTRAGQVGTIGVVMLLVPVYTYEHHCIWAIPAVVASLTGLIHGRLSAHWAIPLGAAFTIWAFEISWLRGMHNAVEVAPPIAFVVQEFKFVALVLFGIASATLGSIAPPSDGRLEAP